MRPTFAIAALLALVLLPSCATYQVEPLPPAPPGPASLQRAIDSLAAGFGDRVGIAVEDVSAGWAVGHDADRAYPQQSVSKLWVALAVFGDIERGRLKLNDPVLVTKADMSVFNQPIQKLLTDQGYRTTIDGLLDLALAHSDNAANDILLKRVGGPKAVWRALAARSILGIHASPPEQVLESRVAAVRWRPEYSFGQAFWTARDAVPMPKRVQALQHYLDDPADGAEPRAITDGLARLKRGALLGPAMTAHYLQILGRTETGPARLPAGLGPGWTIAHKTGSGQDLGALSTGYNDVGLITAPDGHAYAIAVMIASTHRPIPERQALMAAVTRAVVELHDSGLASAAPASRQGAALIAAVRASLDQVRAQQAAAPPRDDAERIVRLGELDQAPRMVITKFDWSTIPADDRAGVLRTQAAIMDGLEQANLAQLLGLVPPEGWFPKSRYGAKASQAAFLIIQHADTDAQRRFLPKLEAFAKTGEIQPDDVAAMADRVAISEGRPQRYGTQFRCDGGKWRPYPMEDQANVEALRRGVGFLITYAQTLAMFQSQPPCPQTQSPPPPGMKLD